ncbi:MAG: polyprenol monophosphomannose synthase [Thermomicrobiaceae bacterium]|nr:polyprenol monophosphomannose synthase [Thermomicrobiaceae bacterium]
MQTTQTIVIIPTYNERDNLPRLLPAILERAPEVHILIVDDASPDGTGDVADAFAASDPRIHVLHRPSREGLAQAYLAGFRQALALGYDRIVQMDADFSHRPEDLPRLLEATESADVVIGSRRVPGGRTENWSPLREAVSRGGSLYARLLLDLPVRDCTSGFKCLRRQALEAIDLDRLGARGFAFSVEMNYRLHQAGCRIVEVPIVFPDRTAGRSKMSPGIFLEAMRLVWGLRERRPVVASSVVERVLRPPREPAA